MSRASLFTAFLLVLTAILLGQSIELSPGARPAPLRVLVPTLLLLGLQLALDLSPRLRRRLRVLRDSLLQTSSGSAGDAATGIDSGDSRRRKRREIRLALWIVLLLGGIYLAGFYPASILFLLPFLRIEGGVGWRATMITTAATIAIVYFAFGLLVRLPLPEGVMF